MDNFSFWSFEMSLLTSWTYFSLCRKITYEHMHASLGGNKFFYGGSINIESMHNTHTANCKFDRTKRRIIVVFVSCFPRRELGQIVKYEIYYIRWYLIFRPSDATRAPDSDNCDSYMKIEPMESWVGLTRRSRQ